MVKIQYRANVHRRAINEWLSIEKQGKVGNKHRETPAERYASSWSDSLSQ